LQLSLVVRGLDLTMSIAKDQGIHEQLEYYRARSSEYDQWWYRKGRYDRGAAENAHWFRDAAEVVSALTRFGPSGRILELACGTGIWSEKLLPYASELTLIDGSREMLNLAERRLHVGNVRYVEADLFDWRPEDKYDTVFFSFWLSHVPPSRFGDFWRLVGDCVAPGGRVFFVDSQHEQTSTAIDHRLPDRSDIQLVRRLNDGREFRIFKLFYDAQALQKELMSLGWNISVSATQRYFIYGHSAI